MSRTTQFLLRRFVDSTPSLMYVDLCPSLWDRSESHVANTSYPSAMRDAALPAASSGRRQSCRSPENDSEPSSSRHAPQTHTYPVSGLNREENHPLHQPSRSANSSPG